MKTKDHVLNLLSHGFKFDTVARLNESQVRVLSEKLFKEKTKEVKIKDSKLKNEIKNFIKTHSKIKDIDENINEWTDEELIDKIKGYAKHADRSKYNKKAGDLFKEFENESKGKKEETKEQEVTKKTTTTYEIPAQTAKTTGADIGNVNIKVDPSGMVKATEIAEDDDTVNVVNDPDATEDGMGIFEKFESKSQQRLFYSRCGNGKTKTEKKWCKWAKEFSKETNYETTPEKKEKNESDEKFIEESIVRLIEKNVNPKMSKGDLIRTINEKSQESSMILKNPLKNTMFSKESGIEMKRMKKPTMGMPVMGTMEENTKEKEAPVKEPGIKTPPKRRDNPFKNPNPGTKEKPRGQKKTKDEIKKDFIGLIKQALNK